MASFSGRPWRWGEKVLLLLCFCFVEEVSAAVSSFTRGGWTCDRDLRSFWWPILLQPPERRPLWSTCCRCSTSSYLQVVPSPEMFWRLVAVDGHRNGETQASRTVSRLGGVSGAASSSPVHGRGGWLGLDCFSSFSPGVLFVKLEVLFAIFGLSVQKMTMDLFVICTCLL